MNILRNIVKKIEAGDRRLLNELNRFYSENSPMHRLLGLEILDIGVGYIKMRFRYSEKIMRIGGFIHGGAIATAIDQAGGLASMTVHDMPNQVTMELKINFLRPLTKENEPYFVEAEVLRNGRRTIVTLVKIYDNKHKVSAVGLGTWYKLEKL